MPPAPVSPSPPAPVSPAPPTPASVERDVLPQSTDPGITQALQAHVAINPSPSVAATGKLVVFLPGTQATPDGYRLILRDAAARGYHAAGVNYVNGVAVGQLCATEPDRDCHGKVRQEVITGQDTSALVSVGPVDSIVNRLAKLLIALNQQYPSEGWGQYLNTQLMPDWSKINLAGHSQGGGHAGLMARMYNLNRAAYFSSPADWRNFANQPATWMSMPSITPVSRQYGFTHLSDPLVPYSNIVPIWQALQLDTLGPAASVDGSASPWGGSHQLTTNATPGSNLPTAAHGATVFDVSVPRSADGSPSFRSVWSAMLYP